jgi:acetylornithine deacetylase/succinyl-diaminopimelate desuccinylase-like protein
MIGRLRELVGIESTSKHEHQVQEYIFQSLKAANLSPFWQPSVGDVSKDNILLRLPGKDPTRAFVFNGHRRGSRQ